MNKKIIALLMVCAVVGSVTFNVYGVNQMKQKNNILIQQIQKDDKKIADTNVKLTTMQKKYEELMKEVTRIDAEAERIEDEKEILKQQLENEKLLRTAAEKKARSLVSLSRGSIISSGTFNNYSRIDVVTGLSARQLNKAFKGTGMEGTGDAFVRAEKEYGVNAIFLASIAALESGWGDSFNARNKNNLFGFGSYDNDPSQTVVFSSKTQGVTKVANALRRDYLNKGGVHYNGATPKGVNTKYCTSSDWDNQITEIMNMIVDRIT